MNIWQGAVLALSSFILPAAGLPSAKISLNGGPQVMYDSAKDGCSGIDTPDLNPRAFCDAKGEVALFGLHFVNRALRGPDLSHLRIDCAVALGSNDNPDAAAYDSRNYIAATWTDDGSHVAAIVHHEYHADQFGTCSAKGDLACWYNSLIAYRSADGGRSFAKAKPFVVAAAPFRQEAEQGRHRGFFNPSNIVGEGPHRYFFGSTTGWGGQGFGNCLFRSDAPADSASWRAYDGKAFAVRFADPYASAARPAPCQPVGPFVFPVGAVVHLRGAKTWVAVWQASRDGRDFPLDGFYYATGTTLLDWSAPRLLLAGKTLYNGPCDSGGRLLAYPSLLDESARGRNFDDSGPSPWLYYTELKTSGCGFTGVRRMMRVRLEIKPS